MKRRLALGALLLGLQGWTAHAESAWESTSFALPLTGAVPVASTEGVALLKSGMAARAVRVLADAGAGASFLGTGVLQCFYLPTTPAARRWRRCPDGYDVALAPGARDIPAAEFQVTGFGRVAYVPLGVGVSSGSTLTLTLEVVYQR